MRGSFNPLAKETENASIASPTPSRILFRIKPNVMEQYEPFSKRFIEAYNSFIILKQSFHFKKVWLILKQKETLSANHDAEKVSLLRTYPGEDASRTDEICYT